MTKKEQETLFNAAVKKAKEINTLIDLFEDLGSFEMKAYEDKSPEERYREYEAVDCQRVGIKEKVTRLTHELTGFVDALYLLEGAGVMMMQECRNGAGIHRVARIQFGGDYYSFKEDI